MANDMPENEEFVSPREVEPETHEVPVVDIEELVEQAEAGTLAEPEPSVGSVLLDAAAPGVEAAVDVVADAAEAESDADPLATVEGAIPLSQVKVPSKYVNFKLVETTIDEEKAKAIVATLPDGSFYKKNPLDPRPGYRVYARV